LIGSDNMLGNIESSSRTRKHDRAVFEAILDLKQREIDRLDSQVAELKQIIRTHTALESSNTPRADVEIPSIVLGGL